MSGYFVANGCRAGRSGSGVAEVAEDAFEGGEVGCEVIGEPVSAQPGERSGQFCRDLSVPVANIARCVS